MSAPRTFLGKAALVSGGTSGIGLACCRTLVARGAGLVFCSTSEERVQEATTELEGLGGGAVAGYVCDVADPEGVRDLVAETLRLFGQLDVCVAAAGVGPWGRFEDLPLDQVRRLLAVNVDGVYHVVTAAGTVMRNQRSGSIVTIGSISGLRANRDGAAYCASKAAVHLLTKATARELAPDGVRVNCVAPGWVDTDMNDDLRHDEQALRAICAEIPLGRLAQPHEIAEVVAFLAGDEAAAISGAVVVADGGLTAD
jgi:NAD(P)-dependent dehydrogenase (short-subunit alcohol dehydrogenase family)